MLIFNLLISSFLLADPASSMMCGTEAPSSDRLIAMINDETQEKDYWSLEKAQSLSFCIQDEFPRGYELLDQALREAAAEWMKYANVDFQVIDDLSCAGQKREPLFTVTRAHRRARYNARAFFPGYPESKRVIKIKRKIVNGPYYELKRIVLHELGHVLGFRHEHIHEDAGGECPEKSSFETITDYDLQSIMHYGWCGKGKKNFVLSDLDKEGAGKAYPY